MSDFIVSARKYRPATFDTVVGQSHITNTLKNAILNKQLAHAFLFCGPRGVGKTTCARILAKTINCFDLQPSGEACDKCDSCESFRNGQSFNIVELDAASNNSVDDIRNLIENVRYAPQLGKYKIFIIDEVHMLSSQAFNAFLKTLEEPPAHALFILATTEKYKILPTILSRCQIFDFNRIQVDDIANRLAFIANEEHVNAEADALHVIAQKADGGLRDACSMFDQIVTFSGSNITYQHVIENLNILDYDYYFSITDSLLEGNIGKALVIFNEILSNGFDGHLFISGLASHLRNLLVTRDEATLQLLEVTNSIKLKYKEQCSKCSILFIVNGITICSKTDFQYKVSKNQRLLVELALMQIANTEATAAEKKNDISEKPHSVAVENNKANEPELGYSIPKIDHVETPKVALDLPIKKEEPIQTIAKPNPQPKLHTTGLSSFLNKKSISENVNQTATNSLLAEGPFDIFTEKELQNAWQSFANRFDKTHNIHITLTTHKPTFVDTKISFLIDNAAQHLQLSEMMQDILAFMRKELKNMAASIELIINKDESKRVPYTNREKFEAMAKKNPALLYLKEKFEGEL